MPPKSRLRPSLTLPTQTDHANTAVRQPANVETPPASHSAAQSPPINTFKLFYYGIPLPPLFLGQVAALEKHLKENQQSTISSALPITILNANAINTPEPLGKDLNILYKAKSFIKDEKNKYTPFFIEEIIATKEGRLYNLINIHIKDNCSLIKHIFDAMTDKIHNSLMSNQNTYVLCHAGISRSVSLVMAYYAKYLNYTDYTMALSDIQKVRCVADPQICNTLAIHQFFASVKVSRSRQTDTLLKAVPEETRLLFLPSGGPATAGAAVASSPEAESSCDCADTTSGLATTPTLS